MLDELNHNGFAILPQAANATDCEAIACDVGVAMKTRAGDTIEAGKGRVVGGRNLLSVWDGWRQIVAVPVVKSLIDEVLGQSAGVVRILYFDKPPGQGWSLALHKDRTIAVKQHRDPATPFAKPTKKAGVPHVEASEELLQRMLTLRLHLDPMHDDNGPLMVVPESHRDFVSSETRNQETRDIETIHCDRGDLFVMRPLLSHGSRAANPETNDHRRVVHLELAPEEYLPSRYDWFQFEPLDKG